VGIEGVFGFCGVALLAWAYLAYTMKNPTYLGSFMINVGLVDEQRAKQLIEEIRAIEGVAEVVLIPEDGIAYLKVDNQIVDKKALLAFRCEDTMARAEVPRIDEH